MISGVIELRAVEIMSHISSRDGFGIPARENQNEKGIIKKLHKDINRTLWKKPI